MATSPYHISSLLDKMSSVDKDFRFMATNDLMSELQKDSIKLDDDSEKKVVLAILKLVQDKNGEVQNLAVRCLGPLIRKVKEAQVEAIISELCSNMFSDDERLRDISSVGLKTVIAQLPQVNQSLSNMACKNITDELLGSVGNSSLNQYVLLECLDILSDLIHKHGVVLSLFHEDLLHSLMPMLVDPKPISVRKRACTALCYLSACCQQDLYDVLLTQVIKKLADEQQSQTSFTNVRTFLQCVGAISRQSGQRVNSYLPTILPLLMHFVNSEDDELKEACLQAFEVLVCFREITSHVTEIVQAALNLLAHDPNYNYDSDEDDDFEDEDAMETDDPEQEEDDSYSDDDDVSWKVRRAAAKCVSAIVTARPELLAEFYSTVSPVLIARFKEREENVKADIFQAYRTLLQVTRSSVRIPGQSEQECMETSESPLSMLNSQIPNIVKALHRQLKDKSVKTRQGCFGLLTDLVLILPGSLENEIGCLVPGIVYCLNDSAASSNMRIDCLVFLNALITSHPPSSIHPHVGAFMPVIIKSVDDSFYKITSEALLVLQNMVKVIRPLDVEVSFDYGSYAEVVYGAAMDRLSAADIDQEVKERAITCMGQVIGNLGDVLKNKLPECLPVYVSRLKNEITRLTTVKALTMITRSTLKIDISSIQLETIPLLAAFLRKNHRDLRLATLVCLNQLLVCYSIPNDLIEEVLGELPQLISDNDLHISQHVLTVICTIMNVNPQSVQKIKVTVLPNVTTLLLSSLLQGNALKTMADFFSKLVELNQPGLQFQETFQMLVQLVQVSEEQTSLHRQTYYSISRCIAVICFAVPENTLPVVKKFVSEIELESVDESNKLLALFSIGEIGKYTDLSSIGNIQKVIIELFGSTSEEIRSAASYALGNVCAGNLETYLPFILSEIQATPKRQYLLLHSLKEIITCYGSREEGYAPLKPYVGKIWEMLFTHFQTLEEGTRNVVAECVGKLTLVEPTTLLPLLRNNLDSELPHVRSTVITALKYTISDHPQEVDTQLSKYIGDFMVAISDPDLNVRRVALVAFNSAAHNKPSLIRDLLDTILPNLYNETKVRKELIRQVEMGPFKHTVDDGLDLRKAAFECMYTLLETCLDRLDIFEFLNHVEDGLRDHYDIKMLTFLLLVRLSHLRPSTVLQRIDRLVEPLRVTVQSRVKANSVKQEFEKQEEMKRSALRTVVALLAIPDAEKNPQLMEFLQQIKSNTETSFLFESVRQDSTRSKGERPGGGGEPMELN